MRKLIMIAVLMLASLGVTPSVFAASSGKCGENITWTLDDEGNLVIDGTGKMAEFYILENVPWGQGVKTVKMSDGITNISSYAFKDCVGLQNINAPNSVTEIGYSAFDGCTRLSNAVIGKAVINIEDYAFKNCSALKSIELPKTLERIGNSAFEGCTGLLGIDIPDGVSEIGIGAFSFCSGLTNVKISESVTEIMYITFRDCSSLQSVVVPNSVTKIGIGAFSQCENMTKLVIGKNLSAVGDYAFQNCTSLNKIISYALEPPVCTKYDAFDGIDKSKCPLEVPDESVDKYKTAEVWKEFMNISGVENVVSDSDIAVRLENGNISVIGAPENADMEIYSIAGAVIYQGKVDAVKITDDGIYIIKVSGKVFKVIK